MNMHMSSSNEIHIFKRFAFEHCGTISLKINDILIHNLISMKLHIYANVRYWEDAEVN